MAPLIRVQSVEPLEPQNVRVRFTNGEQRVIDLTPYISKGEIFDPVRSDPAVFCAVRIEGRTVAWPNGADIDPDVLYYGGPPPWAKNTLLTQPTSNKAST